MNFITFNSYAQTIDSSAYSRYSFIHREYNLIQNDSISLSKFYEKLYQLQKTKKGRINIVHIGDSHIQADFFSGMVRQKLQLEFGNAGRGLVFPYHLAKSNEPSTYKTSSKAVWTAKRNVFYTDPIPMGISGFTIQTEDSTAVLDLAVKDQPGLNYSFTKFTLFHDKEPFNYDITVCDDDECEQGTFKAADNISSPFVSKINFDHPLREIILRNKKSDSGQQSSTRIYGMLLQNDSAGIEYDMIGANGAEYKHYNMSKYFIKQIPELHPDLIIISLGTNEGFNKDFDSSAFYKNIDTLVGNLKISSPGIPVLLTTPGDSYQKAHRKYVKNPGMELAEQTEIKYCTDHNMPWWDWYNVMGGFGSMAMWFKMKLTAYDHVHLGVAGYKIQGDLFYTALMKGYTNYLDNKSHYPCYSFEFAVTDTNGSILKANCTFNISMYNKTKHPPLRIDTGKMEYTSAGANGNYFNANLGCGGDSVEYMRISIHHGNQTMFIMSKHRLPTLDAQGQSIGIVRIVFKPNSTLYWDGKIDKENKPIFKCTPTTITEKTPKKVKKHKEPN